MANLNSVTVSLKISYEVLKTKLIPSLDIGGGQQCWLNTYSIVVAAMFNSRFILSKRLTAVEQTTTEQKRAEKPIPSTESKSLHGHKQVEI